MFIIEKKDNKKAAQQQKQKTKQYLLLLLLLYCGLQIKKDINPQKLVSKNAFKNLNKHLPPRETDDITLIRCLRKSVYCTFKN